MHYPNSIEDICYDQNHIDSVWAEINTNMPRYLKKYIELGGNNNGVSKDTFSELAAHFGSSSNPNVKAKSNKTLLGQILNEAVSNFEDDRQTYLEHLNLDALEEYGEDVSSFKNTILQHQIPIIRKTLQNKAAKELDKFRAAFIRAQPGDLYNVTLKIVSTAEQWRGEWYNVTIFKNINTCDDLDYYELDEEGYTVFGVIGGGIKSHFIYKIYPDMFPNRSREAIWALWYLSSKKSFGCKQDSEFLMIDIKEGTTQQNYFYPYGLFAFYALLIYKRIEAEYLRNNLEIPTNYRFVIVDNFLSFVARQNQKEIDVLKQNSKNEHYDY